MAQRKQLTWAELRVGVFVLIGLVITAAAILYVTGGGALSPKYQLNTYLPEVEGLEPGAPVRLSGVEVGNVDKIILNPHPQDRFHNIQVRMRIRRAYQDDIRTDSAASLITEGLLGNRYVTITRGIEGTPIPSGGVIRGQEEKAIQQIVERGNELVENLTVLSKQINEIVHEVQNGRGTLGKLLNDASLYNHLNSTAAHLDTVAGNIEDGEGTVGKLVSSDELYRKVDATVSEAQTALVAVHDQKGTLGKLLYDPGLYDNTKETMAKTNAMLGDIEAGRGTLGKLAKDETLYNNLRDASANVRDASAKMNSRQGTLGKVFTDPELYDNLTGLTGETQKMISQFRQNPKKFLHVKFSIF